MKNILQVTYHFIDILCKQESILIAYLSIFKQKVVRNDHVMAIVRIREEELEREEQAEREQNIMAIERQCADEKDLPKLTRSKAKELNQLPLDLMPVKPIKPAGDELVALIREELHSDDDDEEYQPAEDDIEVSACEIASHCVRSIRPNI